MTVERLPDGSLEIAGLESFLIELLKEIFTAADPGEGGPAHERLFPSPLAGDPEAEADWKEYVHPDLKDLFRSALEIVAADLAQMEGEEGGDTLRIPANHVEPWLNALNQARLSLAARHHFTEREMEGLPPDVASENRALALFQVQYYGILQEILLRDGSEE